MALWLVNQTPQSDLLKPGGLVQFSLKSDSARATLGSLLARFGISRLVHAGTFPEDDQNLLKYGTVSLVTPEHVQPVTGDCRRSLSSGRLVITKESDDTADTGIYEYKVPVDPGTSSLAYFKLRRHGWTVGARPWVSYPTTTGIRMGLVSGLLKTSFDIVLVDDGGDGGILFGGPIDGASRSHEDFTPFPWKLTQENENIEVWIFLNHKSDGPEFELWGRLPNGAPSLLTSLPVSALALGSAYSENTVTAYFGNAGFAGDVMEVEDWGLYPDFREIVNSADALPGNSIIVLPDAPTIYRADSGDLPNEFAPGRWFSFGDTKVSFGFEPGRKVTPQSVVVDKYALSGDEQVAYNGRVGFERTEPRLSARSSGFMVEAFVSGFAKHVDTEVFGAGIGANDGLYAYRALMYKTAIRNTIALQSNGDQTSLAEQYDSGKTLDWETMKLVRLAVDRDRGRASLWVDDDLVSSVPLSKNFPRSRKSSVEFGHLLDAATQGQVNLGFINYLTQYQAYEATDGVTPDQTIPVFAMQNVGSGSDFGTMEVANSALIIRKPSFHVRGTRHDFYRTDRLDVSSGALVDFRARVPIFWDLKGTPMAASALTGAGLTLYFGTKKLQLAFYNCGVHGKYIGVVPGSGSDKDIIEQTDLGRAFSAPVDWTQMETYRIVCRAYDKIEIWVGKTTNKSAIVIPWRNDTDGFDLPLDVTGPGISFGHFDGMSGSTSEWEFIRWGVSSGYDIAVSQGYPQGIREDQYGGKSLLMTDIIEDA